MLPYAKHDPFKNLTLLLYVPLLGHDEGTKAWVEVRGQLEKVSGLLPPWGGGVDSNCQAWWVLFAPCALPWLYGRSSALLNLLSLTYLGPLHQICN